MKLLKDLGMQFPKPNSKRKYRYGLYECPDCLQPTKAQTTSVNRGQTKRCASCGGKVSASKQTREQKITHGDTGTRLHNIWNGMIDRCRRETHPMWKHYGGKGVKVCTMWQDYIQFKKWAEENGYEEHLTIERMDNDGGYEPSNCMWATRKEQSNNQTHSILRKFTIEELKVIQLNYYSSKLNQKEYAESVGLKRSSLQKLIAGGYENLPKLDLTKEICREQDNRGRFKSKNS